MKTLLMLVMFVAVIVDLWVLVFSISRADRKRAIYIALLAVALMFYSYGYLLEVRSTSYDMVKFSIWTENIGIPLIAPFYLLSVLSMFKEQVMKKWMLFAALSWGVVFSTIVFLNDYHLLYYSSITFVPDALISSLKLGYGPLFVVQQVVSTICIIASIVVLVKQFVKGNKKVRSQMMLYMVGASVSLFASTLNFSGVLPTGLDPTPIASTIALVLFAVRLSQLRLMDVVSEAFASAAETMDDGMIILNNDYEYAFSNQSAKRSVPGLEFFPSAEPIVNLHDWPEELKGELKPGYISFDFDGNNYRASISEVFNSLGKQVGWSLVVRNMSEITTMINQLEELAITDELTGLTNRRHFIEIAEREISIASRHNLNKTMVFFDIDFFKVINDTYGHYAGDDILCAITRAVGSQLRAHDLFGRYGGEEFVILTIGGELNDIVRLVERLRISIENTIIDLGENIVSVTASFGVVQLPDECDLQHAIDSADRAMYQAKNNGRNNVAVGEYR